MKSENILLTVCLSFVCLVVVGLSIQSCRCTDRMISNRSNTSSTAYDKQIQVKNDFVFNSLLKQDRNLVSFTEREYEAVIDSSGNVTGSRLTKERTWEHIQEQTQDSTSGIQQQHVNKKDSGTISQHTQSSDKHIQKQAPNLNVFFILILSLTVGGLLLKYLFRR